MSWRKVLLTAVPNGFSPGLTPLLGALFLSMVSLYLLAATALAAGGTIHVVSNESEVRFPDDVAFNLDVEGKADIVEVRLYYRVLPSRVWSYTYPELAPSRRVETSFRLDVSGGSYLPPGAQVEYYYSIEDAQGNVLETERQTFTYVDSRLPWRTVDVGPLTIYWHNMPEVQVQEVARQVGHSLEEIAGVLQVDLDVPIKGVIYNSMSEAQEAFPYQSGTISEERVFRGFAFPDRGVFVGVGLDADLIVHESAHLLLAEAISSPGARVPSWINEGFASYMEPGNTPYDRSFPRGASASIMRLRHMGTIPGRPTQIQYFYRKSESVVGYLLETHGTHGFQELVAQIDAGKNPDSALVAAYGFGIDELDQRWAASLTGSSHDEPGTGGGGSTFPYLSTVLIAVLALLVFGLSLAGFLIRKMREGMEGPDADGLTQEEWEDRP